MSIGSSRMTPLHIAQHTLNLQCCMGAMSRGSSRMTPLYIVQSTSNMQCCRGRVHIPNFLHCPSITYNIHYIDTFYYYTILVHVGNIKHIWYPIVFQKTHHISYSIEFKSIWTYKYLRVIDFSTWYKIAQVASTELPRGESGFSIRYDARHEQNEYMKITPPTIQLPIFLLTVS